MHIYVMRHGEAVFNAPNDASRSLTNRGKQQAQRAAEWLLNQSVILDTVLVSPYLRAQQTYEVLSETMGLSLVAETYAVITPNGDERKVCEYLDDLAQQGHKAVLLVSHLPLVGDLVEELCPGSGVPMFPTAAVMGIDYDLNQGQGIIISHYHP